MNVKVLHMKHNQAQHHCETPHTTRRHGGPVGPDGPDSSSAHLPEVTTSLRPLCQTPSAMACVPSPLTRRTHINRRVSHSTAHSSSAAPRESISPQRSTSSKRHESQHHDRGQTASRIQVHRGPEKTSQRTEKGKEKTTNHTAVFVL